MLAKSTHITYYLLILSIALKGSRGGPGSDWYIENVLQELDAPGEWFYDAGSKMIYYFNNASSGTPPAEDMEVVGTNLQVCSTLLHGGCIDVGFYLL